MTRSPAATVRCVYDVLHPVYDAVTDLADHFTALVREQGADLLREDLAKLRPPIDAVLCAHAGLVCGAGVITGVGVLADAPRWLEWWMSSPGGLRPLHVALDPVNPEFYDYTAAEWFEVPRRLQRAWVVGPYVDVLCTNEYTLTMSTPVLVDEQFHGVAAADIDVTSLERRLLPLLQELPRPAVLVNADDRAIVSSHPGWSPGAIVSPMEQMSVRALDQRRKGARLTLPWRLVVDPA